MKYQLTLEISRGFFISGRPGTKSPGPSRLSKFRLRFAVAKLHLLVADGVNQEVKSSHFPRGECSYAWSNPVIFRERINNWKNDGEMMKM